MNSRRNGGDRRKQKCGVAKNKNGGRRTQEKKNWGTLDMDHK